MVKVENKIENKAEEKSLVNFDINKIISKAQSFYEKKEFGLAKQISLGSSMYKPMKDSDFILYTKNDFWQKLTNLRGLLYGRIHQLSGLMNSGKSSIALEFMIAAQQQNNIVVLFDSERKFAPARFEKMGGDINKLIVIDTSNILNGVKAVANTIIAIKEEYKNSRILCVWDSIGASINSTEDSEDNEDYSKQPGITAKEISFAIRKINKLMNKYYDRETGENTIACLILNQVYANIGSVGSTERGGTELGYLSSIIIQLTRKKNLTRIRKGQKYFYGILTVARVKKNHLFDAQDCIAELDLVVSADGVLLASEAKNDSEVVGWDEDKDD